MLVALIRSKNDYSQIAFFTFFLGIQIDGVSFGLQSKIQISLGKRPREITVKRSHFYKTEKKLKISR